MQLPCWSGRVEPVPLVGGITNKNYLVADRGEKFVVRLGEDIPIHGVMRFNELAASRAAFEAGISPEVIYAEPGALVLRFIEGRTLTSELMRDPALLAAAVDLVKRCHERIPQLLRVTGADVLGIPGDSRLCGGTLRTQRSRYAALVPELVERAQRLERDVGPVTIVFGHNDLLAANFIDDGERLWLIDWDYAGFNSPLFDLGGLVSNSDLDADQARFVLERYFGHVDRDSMRAVRRDEMRIAAARNDVEHGVGAALEDCSSTTPRTRPTTWRVSAAPTDELLGRTVSTLPQPRRWSSSAAASSAAARRTISRPRASKTSCCSSARSSRAAPRGMRPDSSVSCARPPTSRSC